MLQTMRRVISATGVKFIARWESFVPYVYDDKARLIRVRNRLVPPPYVAGTPVKGTLTIGFGHTDAARHPMKCADMIGQRITEKQGYEILDVDLDEVEADVNRLVKVPITQGQYDALCSFGFNCGAGNLAKLIVPLNRGDAAGTRRKFDLYVRSKGEFMQGLQNRRDAEQVLWDGAEPDAVKDAAPAVFVETPKAVEPLAPPKSLAESRIVQGAAAAGTATLPPVAGAVIKSAADDGPETAAPSVVERVTEVVDQGGNLINRGREVVEVIPAPPQGFWRALAAVLTDPIVVCVFGALALAAIGFVVWERRRKLREEGV